MSGTRAKFLREGLTTPSPSHHILERIQIGEGQEESLTINEKSLKHGATMEMEIKWM